MWQQRKLGQTKITQHRLNASFSLCNQYGIVDKWDKDESTCSGIRANLSFIIWFKLWDLWGWGSCSLNKSGHSRGVHLSSSKQCACWWSYSCRPTRVNMCIVLIFFLRTVWGCKYLLKSDEIIWLTVSCGHLTVFAFL